MKKLVDISPVARSIPYDPTGTSIFSENVQDVLTEIRREKSFAQVDTTTTTNGTLNLIAQSPSEQGILGSATGFSVVLPNATELNEGRSFRIFNESSESIAIKDYDGTTLITLNTDSVAELICHHTLTSAGQWYVLEASATAKGITSYTLTSNVTFQTSATTPTLITGFTLTPESGTYAAWFSSDLIISANNRIGFCSIFVGGTENANTLRRVQGVSSSFETNFQTLGIISANGSQAVDVRVYHTGGAGDITVGQRSMVLVRLGGA